MPVVSRNHRPTMIPLGVFRKKRTILAVKAPHKQILNKRCYIRSKVVSRRASPTFSHGSLHPGDGGGRCYFSNSNARLRLFRRALWLNIPGLFLVVTICVLDGMVIFATYADCDLREQRKITRGDQVENGGDLVWTFRALSSLRFHSQHRLSSKWTMSLNVIPT